MAKVEPIQLVYFDHFCKTHWELWDNFKKHMIDVHGEPEEAFIDKENQ